MSSKTLPPSDKSNTLFTLCNRGRPKLTFTNCVSPIVPCFNSLHNCLYTGKNLDQHPCQKNHAFINKWKAYWLDILKRRKLHLIT